MDSETEIIAAKSVKTTLAAAFQVTIPVLTGFLFLGFAYGVLMKTNGFSTPITSLMSALAFCGSFQFAAIALMAAGFNPISTFIMCVLVNARHLFYGISLLHKYKGLGKIRFLLIYMLCDETFSIVASTEPPEGVGRKGFYAAVSLLDYLYWQTGTLLGSLTGGVINFNTQGLDFVLTALFVVLFLEQWKNKENRPSCLIGIACTAVCLIVFGAESFIIPAMVCIMLSLTAGRKFLKGKEVTS